MLLEVTASSLLQRCDMCGSVRELAHAILTAGVEHGDPPVPADPNIIVLPPCAACGASEFLHRVRAVDGGGGRLAGAHRRAVNALHAALVAAGRVPGSMSGSFASETEEPERAELPWVFPGEPRPIVGRRDGPSEGGG